MEAGSTEPPCRDVGAVAGGRRLLIDAAGTLTLNVTTVALNFVLILVLSRVLGATEFGAYASAFAWAGVLAVVAVLGLSPLVIRHVAAYARVEAWSLMRGLLRQANRAVLVASFATVAAAACVGTGLYSGRPLLLHPFLVALALIPLIALTSLRQAAMQGLGRVVIGRLPETLVTPSAFVLLVALVSALRPSVSATWAVGLQVAATAGAFALGAWLLHRSLPPTVHTAAPAYDTGAWKRSASRLVVMNVVMAANAQVGTILLGILADPRAAGVFNVAFRITTLISFVLLAASYPLGPLVARLEAEGRRDEVQRVVVRAARAVLAVSVPVTIVILVFVERILSLFGAHFGDGATAVWIMAVGDIVNVLTGYGGLVLVMSGREADLARSVILGALFNLGLGFALISPFGPTGAAIATAASVTVTNLATNWWSWRRLRVWAAVVVPARAEPRAG
jgi:O-antigen/teichoic acid export membrane protein